MSKTIDEKVVEMRFDNKQFESNVSQSMSTLDKLKRSLNLTDAAKGLEGVSSAAKSIDMSSLSDGVHTVGLKFNALYTMADQALRNITNSAMYYGKRIVSALTIDPIKTGFSEYELKMGSVQTIMASTGESLESVNDYLEELNTYADKTIYSFSDMTSNIGKFTNAGVGLKDAVSAIKGVSNVAAVSGANASDASRAMYNFAQALSAGYVKLIDWKSIENANMATVEFKEQLLETAVSLGTVTKEADGTYKTLKGNTFSATKNFNEVLQDQWMTTDVLVKTLGKYSDETTDIGKKAFSAAQDVKTLSQLFDTLKEAAQSGWSQTWEIIVGDFEEAKKFLTEVNEIASGILDASANARNDMLENWKIMGGRDDLIQSLRNSIEAISSIIKPIKEAFRDIFPPMTSEKLLAFTQGLKDLTAKLIISDKTAENIKRTFKGLFAVIDIFKTIITSVFKALGLLTGSVGDLGGGLLGVTAFLGDLLVAFRDVIKSSKIFDKIFQTIAKSIKLVINIVSKLPLDFIFASLATLFENIISKIVDIGESTSDVKSKVIESFSAMGNSIANSKFFKFIQGIWNGIKTIAKGIGNVLLDLVNRIGNANFDSFLELIKTISLTSILVYIAKFVKNLSSLSGTATKFKDAFLGITKSFKNVLDEVGNTLKAFQLKVKAEALKKVAIAIGILAASLLVISLIDKERLSNALGALTVLFAEMIGAIMVLNKATNMSSGVGKLALQIVGFAFAIMILASACKKISGMDWDDLTKAGAAIAGLTLMMTWSSAALNSSSKVIAENKKAVMTTAAQMVAFAIAIKLLASVCKDFVNMEWESIGKAGAGIAGLVLIMTWAMVAMSNASKVITEKRKPVMVSIAQMITFALAIKILASVCMQFANMDWESIGKAGAAIGGLALIMLGAITVLSETSRTISKKKKNIDKTVIEMIAFAVSMKILASVCMELASMDWESMGKAGAGMAGLALILVGAMAALSYTSKTISKSKKDIDSTISQMISFAVFIKILASVCMEFASMDWSSIGKAMAGIAGLSILMVAMSAALSLVGSTNMLHDAAGLIVIAGALFILVQVLITLSNMSWQEVGKGLLIIAASLGALGLCAVILTPIIPIILALSAAIALLGVATLAIGAGLELMSAGITALSIALSDGATVIVTSITTILTGILSLIPLLIQKIGEGIIAFCNVIANSDLSIFAAIETVVMSILNALINFAPVIAETVLTLLVSVLNSLVEFTPKIVGLLMNFLINVINSVAENLPRLIEAGVNLIIAWIDGLADAIVNYTEKVRDAFIKLFKSVIESILIMLGIHSPSTVFKDIGSNMILGLINGVKDLASSAVNAIKNLVSKLVEAVKNKFSEFKEKGKEIITNLKNGISNKASEIKSKAKEVISGVVTGIKEKISNFKSIGSNMIEGLKEGIKEKFSSVKEAAVNCVRGAVDKVKSFLGINSPSKLFSEIGKYSDMGMVKGLEEYSSKVSEASEKVGEVASNGMSKAMSNINFIDDIDSQPTIRPILDLSDVSAGAKSINSMFNMTPSVGVMSNIGSISSMMNNRQNGVNNDIISAIGDLRKDLSKVGNTSYNVNGITYDDGSNIASAIKTIIQAAKVERRV